MIAALYVLEDGPYCGSEYDTWGINRDARKYKGDHPVIAHPPCERWGRYWGGGPMLHGTENQKLLGDDGGCFAHALWSVRTFKGILEHPEGSHAFRFFGLPIPNINGGWTPKDIFGGASCCVAQGHYGHRAQKLTWLYSVGCELPELIWGKCQGKQIIDQGFHSKEERARAVKKDKIKRLNKRQLIETPKEFQNLLTSIVITAVPQSGEEENK